MNGERPLRGAQPGDLSVANAEDVRFVANLPEVAASKGQAPWHLPFASLSTALANAPDEPLWTWDGYLAPGALTLLAGRPKVGKSTLAFALLTRAVAGQPFLGRNTRATGVLLLSEEREGTLAEKARRWNLNGRVHLLMRHQAHGHPWPDVVAEAVVYCLARSLGVLVVDTFDKWIGLRGDAENNAGSVIEVLEPLQQAAASGIAVLVIAHQRKSLGDFGDAVRGSNALTGTVDIVAELERPRSDALAGSGVRVLNAVSRFAATPTDLAIALTDDDYEVRGDSLDAQAELERRRVTDAIETLGAPTRKELEEETSLAPTSLRRHLDKLGEDGIIGSRGQGTRADPYRYSIRAGNNHGARVPILTGRQEPPGDEFDPVPDELDYYRSQVGH
jgi:hypothetical protein